jgi:hypothetical protein
MKGKWMETCFIVFVSLYFVGIENGIENPENDYKKGNHQI